MEISAPDRQPGQKRKADSQDNERLSKRLSLLNLERNGSKLYVPVETPNTGIDGKTRRPPHQASVAASGPDDAADDAMRLDDSKHKVYIYNIDDELSSDSEAEDGRLVFLPDIEKHLKQNRIPRHVLANNDGELAGMQVVLYSDPKSLSVPEEKDGVRKAVLEARKRHREAQTQAREGRLSNVASRELPDTPNRTTTAESGDVYDCDAMDTD